MRLDKKDLFAVFFILLLVVSFFSEVLFTNRNFASRSFFEYNYPIRHFIVESIKSGFIPFWNPYLFCGIPFLPNLNASMFYPLSFINYLFPFYFGFKLFIVIHFFLSCLFMYWLMRTWVGIIPSLISGISYGFSGFLLSMVDAYPVLTISTWTPLCLLLIRQAIENKGLYIILLGVFLGIQFLSGAPDSFFISILVFFLFSLSKGKGCYIFLLAGIIGMGLTSFLSLPFLEMCYFSNKPKLGYEDATINSLSFAELFTTFIPISKLVNFWFGQGIVKSCYLGIITFCFILIGIFYPKRKLSIFWVCILFGSILLSMGKYSPVYQLLYEYLPGFSWMRYPVKFFSLTVLSGAILAGLGAEKLFKETKGLHIFWIFNIIYIIFWVVASSCKDFFLSLLPNGSSNWYSININSSFLSLIFLFLATLIFTLKRIGYIREMVAYICIIFTLITDIFVVGSKLNQTIDKGFYTYTPKIVKLFKKDKDLFRILSNYDIEVNNSTLSMFIEREKSALIPNIGLIYHLYDVYGYEGFRLKDYITFLSHIQLKNLSMLNVKYIITSTNIKNMEIFYDGEEFRVYKNNDYLPRAFFVQKARVVKDRQKILDLLTTESFDPKKEVILEEEIQCKIQNTTTHKRIPKMQNVKIIDYQPNWVTINTSCSHNGFLFLSDTYYPGWQAYIDGKKTKIYRANFLFRAILLPKGSHKVEFVFFPLSFKIGLWVTLLTIISIFIAIGGRFPKG